MKTLTQQWINKRIGFNPTFAGSLYLQLLVCYEILSSNSVSEDPWETIEAKGLIWRRAFSENIEIWHGLRPDICSLKNVIRRQYKQKVWFKGVSFGFKKFWHLGWPSAKHLLFKDTSLGDNRSEGFDLKAWSVASNNFDIWACLRRGFFSRHLRGRQ